MPDLNKFNESLDKMIQLMVEMKKSLQTEENRPVVTPQAQETANLELGSFDQLKEALSSTRWPEAVNPNLICDPDSESDKEDRGRGIIELMIEEDLKGLKFLDFGCGEGHCASLSASYGTSLSVGYDMKDNAKWSAHAPQPNMLFTTNYQEVLNRGPYNVILLFDVIDHVEHEEPIALLTRAASALADGGKIYMRCHPFTSRHATHLYHDLNKAYIHLVFTDEELKQILPEPKHAEINNGVTYPIKTYNQYIDAAGLKTVSKREITEKFESFFRIPVISDRIIKKTKMSSYPEFQMTVQFVDYVLAKK